MHYFHYKFDLQGMPNNGWLEKHLNSESMYLLDRVKVNYYLQDSKNLLGIYNS